ncbi:prolipoprotein diacylglyceryl transferase [Maioricimonas sp. JC845]|uniref:prolipoprotein diacylglyceryl transferase n=1 Tax=Maioricimonas sp. JC845 TaxID=3232138 RepID=UPI00345833C4
MRQTLIRIFLDQPWALWKTDPQSGISGPGLAVLWLVGGLLWFGFRFVRNGFSVPEGERGSLVVWLVGLVVCSVIGTVTGAGSFPIFGYGFMLLIGFLCAVWFANRRADANGIDREQILDAGFWILVSGVLGGRIFYLLQYGEHVFAGKSGGELLRAAIDLRQGGLVLVGGMVGGSIGYFTFCYLRKLSPLQLADVLTPSVFIGIAFGRLGCLMNGCCYGDACTLPWGISFPAGSVPFDSLALRGFVDPESAATYPLHPTQIYSALNGFVLAFVTAKYFPRRRHDGDVFALACILYPITRFLIEFLRNDEGSQLGTGLTISQLYSLLILVAGIVLMLTLSWRGRPARLRTTQMTTG